MGFQDVKGVENMLKVDITLKDGTILKEVMLFKGKEQNSGIESISEASELLNKNSGRICFLGSCTWGDLFVNQILKYEFSDEKKKRENRIKQFVDETSGIYDLNDTAEWIINNKEELRKLLH